MKDIGKNNAVTHVISTIVVLGIVIASIAMILHWGLPYVSEKELKAQFRVSQNNFGYVSNSVDNLILESDESKNTADFISTSDNGDLEISSTGDKIIIMYSYNDSFDFNVSGLDDDDHDFTVHMKPHNGNSPSFDKAHIYWLEPEGVRSSFYSTYYPHKRIYRHEWCAQKFRHKDKGTFGHISNITLFLRAHGIMTSDINVSICPNNSGVPDIENPIATNKILYSNVSTSFQWLKVKFTNSLEPLTSDTDYYIVLETPKGDKDVNYYMWYLNNGSSYTDGWAYNGSYNGKISDFTSNSLNNLDFSRRFYYSKNDPPEVEGSVIYFNSQHPKAGVNYSFSVINQATSETDKVSYQVIYGDGYVSSWTAYDDPGIMKSFNHIWEQPGSYQVIIKAKDEYGFINSVDYKNTITVDDFNISAIPVDRKGWYYDLHADASGKITIPSNYPGLTGSYCIDLVNTDKFVLHDQAGYTLGRVPFGKIWVFDLGYLSYTSAYDVGTMKITYQNGALIKEINDKQFIKTPSFLENNKALAFRIYQVLGDFSSGGSQSTTEVSYSVKNSNTREPYYPVVHHFKMNFTGENSDFWVNYFVDNYNFAEYAGRENWVYSTDKAKNLILDSSTVAMEWEGIK